jgi:hypothetical protein
MLIDEDRDHWACQADHLLKIDVPNYQKVFVASLHFGPRVADPFVVMS